MKLLYKNELENATISATNEDSTYPVANITDRFLEKIFQPTGNTVITIEFDEDTDISSIAVGFQNVTTGSYALKNSGGTTILSGSLAVAYETDMTHFTETACRSIDLSFTGTDFYIGGVSAGVPIDIEYFNANPRIDYANSDKSTIVRAGQSTGYRTQPLRKYRATCADLSKVKVAELFDMIDEVGSWKPFYCDFQELSHDWARPIFCLFKGNGQFVRDSYSQDYSTTLVFDEVR